MIFATAAPNWMCDGSIAPQIASRRASKAASAGARQICAQTCAMPVRAAVPDLRYQILTMGRVRREGSVSFLPMTLLVRSSQIDVRCVFDHRTGIATIPNLR